MGQDGAPAIKVAVAGSLGSMGTAVGMAVLADPALELVAAVDPGTHLRGDGVRATCFPTVSGATPRSQPHWTPAEWTWWWTSRCPRR